MLTKKEVLDKSDKEFVKWCIKICPQITKNTDFIYENIDLFRNSVRKNYNPEKLQIYYGENRCCQTIKSTGKECTYGGYFEYQGKIYCGVHSSHFSERKKLPKNPNKDQYIKEMVDMRNIKINEMSQINLKNNRKGDVIVTKLKMMKKPELIDGYLAVFPNYKDQNKKEGFGCASLSPKSLGPVPYFCDILPTAYNLENFHQISKIYKQDILNFDESKIKQFLVKQNNKYVVNLKIDLDVIKKGFLDKTPYRHKYTIKEIPFFTLFYDSKCQEHRFSYVQSRYFYCKWYEILTKNNKDLLYLKKQREEGVNLQIIGYDGYDVKGKDLYECYLDTSKPFGHELVLYTLLTENPEDTKSVYPWDKYAKLNPELYKDFKFIS